MSTQKEPVEVNDVNSTITVPHWGITLRALFGAALSSWENPQPGQTRQYQVQYKDATIATVNVRQHDDINL